jgi:hypothetical protein
MQMSASSIGIGLWALAQGTVASSILKKKKGKELILEEDQTLNSSEEDWNVARF